MKKKYQKPILTVRNDGPVATAVSIPGVDSPLDISYSKIFKPEIRFNPTELPESVSILGPKCPRCGNRTHDLVLYGVMGGNSLSKNRCGNCDYYWGDDE